MSPANNRKRQKVFRRLGFALTNFGTTMYYTRTKLEKYKPRTFFAERKARISMPKFGKFLWRILQHGK